MNNPQLRLFLEARKQVNSRLGPQHVFVADLDWVLLVLEFTSIQNLYLTQPEFFMTEGTGARVMTWNEVLEKRDKLVEVTRPAVDAYLKLRADESSAIQKLPSKNEPWYNRHRPKPNNRRTRT